MKVHKTFTGNLAVLSAKSFQPVRLTIFLKKNQFEVQHFCCLTIILNQWSLWLSQLLLFELSCSLQTVLQQVISNSVTSKLLHNFLKILIQNLTMQCSNCFEHLYLLYWLSVEGGLERDIQDNIHRNGILFRKSYYWQTWHTEWIKVH